MELLIPLLLMILFIALGVPIIAAMGVGTALLLQFTGVVPMTLFSSSLFNGLDSFPLIAIPLFILTGDIIVTTGLSTKLLNFANRVFAGFRSAMGTSTLMGCGLFAAISGSNASAAAAVGRITIDYLDDVGYKRSYAAGLIASGASTGILIPPSISYIIAGFILGISVSDLFLAAFIPGFLVLLSLILTNVVVNRRRGYETKSSFPGVKAALNATWEAKFGLLIPIIILGGIYSGVFTPTEAAAIAVISAIFIGLLSPKWEQLVDRFGFDYRIGGSTNSDKTLNADDDVRLDLAMFPASFERSALVNGVISPIIGVAIVFSQALSALNIPRLVVESLTALTTEPLLIVIIMLVILIAAGAIMETTPNILVLGPLLLPVATEIGMDPIHFVIFMVSALGVGFMTPPIGLNLYVMAGISNEPILDIAKETVPFVITMIFVVLLIGLYSPISMIFI